ncbi:MAG TPA: hypothetical protein VGW80_05415 [Solirubrobacterales bacterium]|nr:hypothetical protein [Solirubrobacterales bacterium]
MQLLFKELSRLRRKRIFHPFGAGFAAEYRPIAESGALALERESEPLVRLSRSVGLPELFPDPCGLAFRFADAYGPGEHQDLLLVSSGAAPGARHTLLPSRGFCDRPYSSVLPYRLRGEPVMLGARALLPAPGPKLADLREREDGGLEFEILLAGVKGKWRAVGRLALGARLPAEQTERLGLDPTNTGGGLELMGLLNRLRGPTYRASQEGRREAYADDG